MGSSRTRAFVATCALVTGIGWFAIAAVSPAATADRKTLLLLPVASGTPGQEWSAKALGGILEDGLSSLSSLRLVAGSAREVALRELAASAAVTPEAFREICRRAGADLAILGGSTLAAGRLTLEIRIFDIAAGRELQTFRGEQPPAQAFDLVEAAIRHVATRAELGATAALFPRGATVSLEAYAAYRTALLEEAPAARIEKLRGVLKLDAEYADPTRRLGVELFRQGSLDEALGVLERAVALGPAVAEARNNFGVALAAAGRADQAQREFEEAVSLAPDYAEARLNLARVFEERGRFSEAEQQYTAVLEADAANDKARAGRAALYDRTGREDLAIKEFRSLSARRPDLAEAEFILAGQEARKAREYARAEKFFRRAADINPQFAQAWAELGTNSYLAGEYAKGVENFRKALSLDSGQAAYHYYLALALDKGGQRDEALGEYRRAVELGGPPEARLGLARAALESGDPGLAVEELNRLLVASPDHAEAKLLLAKATGEMEARRRLVESQSQFANQRLARLEQIVADANRANRELEARLQAATRDKQAPPQSDGVPARDAAAAESARIGELGREIERLQGELTSERDARRREGADAQASLALLRADKDRAGLESAGERERLNGEISRLQASVAAQAKNIELGCGSGEGAELRERLAGLQTELATVQTAFGREREVRRVEAERFKAELATSEAARGRLENQVKEAAELKGRLLAAQGSAAKAEDAQKAERERGERALAAERADRREEVEKLRAELAASLFKKQEKERLLQELAAEKLRTSTAQAAREKSDNSLKSEHEARIADVEKLKAELAVAVGRAQDRDKLAQELAGERVRTLAEQTSRGTAEQALVGERELAAKVLATERASRQVEVDKLKAELAVAAGRAQDRDKLAQELAGERVRTLAEQTSRGTAEQALAGERELAAKVLAAERASRQVEVEKLKAELAVAAGRAQDRDQLAQDLVAERERALAEQAVRGKLEQELSDQRAGGERALAGERARGEQSVATVREESRRQSEQDAARAAALDAQLKTQAQILQAREAELTAALARESSLGARLAKGQADYALLAERHSALEAHTARESQTLADRERALEKSRLAVRELALELGRFALRTQSWEKARGYLEQAAEVDPRSAEAWYGLGEALFQLGQYEKSKQMYEKAKQIY